MKPPADSMKRKWVEAVCPVCKETFSQRPDGRPETCSHHCAGKLRAQRNGGHSPNYKGGRWKINTGYWKVLKRGHHRADANGYVLEHILVAEEKLGRPIRPGEHIHHKNGKRDDNNPDNLEVWCGKDPPGQRIKDILDEAIAECSDDCRGRVRSVLYGAFGIKE